MPELRPFRALRFDASAAGDLRNVVSPPYDVISTQQQRALARRSPHNVVRLDLPVEEPGDPPDEKYRRAARELAAWRSDGTLRKDRQQSVYVYEQSYLVPGTQERRDQRGFFVRLRLEDFGPDSGILPHEGTLSAPKEDRYRLLRATGMNASPVVLLFEDRARVAASALQAAVRRDALSDVTDDEGVRHRLWQLPTDDPELGPLATQLLDAGSTGPLTIADGHHRYETALRYHDERHRDRARCELAPFDYLLALLVPADQRLTILPTHRILRDGPPGDELLASAAALFEIEVLGSRDELLAAFGPAAIAGSETVPAARPHRIGLWTAGTAAILHPQRDAFEPLLDPNASPTLRWLDVTLLAAALERLAGVDRAAAASGGRIAYTKDAAEAIDAVDRGEGVAAWLLDPTAVADMLAVAAAGEVMPQKSTYFYPKQITGLVLNPHEW